MLNQQILTALYHLHSLQFKFWFLWLLVLNFLSGNRKRLAFSVVDICLLVGLSLYFVVAIVVRLSLWLWLCVSTTNLGGGALFSAQHGYWDSVFILMYNSPHCWIWAPGQKLYSVSRISKDKTSYRSLNSRLHSFKNNSWYF